MYEKKKTNSKAIFSTVLQVSDFPAEQVLVAVFPGVPTAAELFLLPNKNQSEDKKKSEEELEQVWSLKFVSQNCQMTSFLTMLLLHFAGF